MKKTKRCVSLILFVFALAFFVPHSSAQTEKKLSSTPKDFQTFYAKFKAAVVHKDKRAVVSMTAFPFEYGWDAGDEGTYNRTQFISKFNDIFGSRKLFSRSNPTFYEENGSYNLTDTSDASHFIFVKKGPRYYFKAFIVEP